MNMRLRDKILYMSFGAGLVVLGMILNSLVGKEADAQVGVQDVTFRTVTCEGLIVKDGAKHRGSFGLATDGEAVLTIYGDDGREEVAYLGGNTKENNEMMLMLKSRSENDKRMATMMIDENGGRIECDNKIGKSVVRLGVGDDGSGGLDTRDKWGYKK